ncbi:unnamed protein product [marine sediment metagenome]|uniref:Uncharacterized protein n=1 Tax=marine sediment metagenome TaxID=412755 RepID=X0TNJ4_9ZZZZ
MLDYPVAIAARIRDLSLRVPLESRDFETIEKIYQQNGVLELLLNEARIRYKKTGNDFTISDVREFSGYARKLSDFDAKVIRVGTIESDHLDVIESCKESNRSIVLYARGRHIQEANKICEELCGERDVKHNLSYLYYSEEELGYSNPEKGIWYFKDHEVEFMRVWLRPVRWVQATDSSWITIE